MTRRVPRFWIYLLVSLLMTWGTCPCVFAKMIRGVTASGPAAEADAPQSTAPC